MVLTAISVIALSACSSRASDIDSLVSDLEARVPAAAGESSSPSLQVAVVADGTLVWSRAFGEGAGMEPGRGTDLVYMNASVQKTFTATAVLQLVERGRIDLDADVSDYVPFRVRHPGYPDTPVTVRMLLSHRSGLDSLPHQFAWDTGSAFSPEYRPPCPENLAGPSLGEFLAASLIPGRENYDEAAWIGEPGSGYHYSVSAYPLLRYMVDRMSDTGYEDHLRKNVFEPLRMSHSGFTIAETGDHAIPHTRSGADNVALPLWDGNGSMMHTTAADSAVFLASLIQTQTGGETVGPTRVLQPESFEAMRGQTTSFPVLFRRSEDMQRSGHGLGLFLFRGGWVGNGGSAPGYQCLVRFHPERRVGFAIFSNVNAILTGGDDEYASARRDIYVVQDELLAVLDPSLPVRSRVAELGILMALLVSLGLLGIRAHRSRRPTAVDTHAKDS